VALSLDSVCRVVSWLRSTLLIVVVLLIAVVLTVSSHRIAAAAADSAAVPNSAPTESPLFDVGEDVYTIDRDMTLYYYMQVNPDGSAQAKREFRFGRNLWNDHAQLRIRVPELTKYPAVGAAYSGLGNIEIGYSYVLTSSAFDHFLETRIALPTATFGVTSLDTQLKAYYGTKWKWRGGGIGLVNEFDQTIIKPPGASWTSYYDAKINVPDLRLVGGVKLSTVYEGRFVFNAGGVYRSAAGGTLFGNFHGVALSVIDTWGIGGNPLWRYKLEANATVRY
jgi:hypothetical protein